MDIAKRVFETIDMAYEKKFNNPTVIAGADKVVFTENVCYNEQNVNICKLDYFYVPKKAGKYPVLFNIHGGGFVAGGKEFRRVLCEWFALQGFFVVNADYGLCPECSFPEPISHLVMALNWVDENKKQFKLDTKRIAVYGDSAGAYYASMLTVLCLSKKLQKEFNLFPKLKFGAVVLNCGLYDVDRSLKNRLIFDLNIKIFESYTGIKEKDFKDYEFKHLLSPLPYIKKNFPPVCLIYADKDIFCSGQTEILIKKLEALDIYYESYRSISILRNHCFSLKWTSKEAREANSMISRFLKKFMKGELPLKQSETSVLIRKEEVKRVRKKPNTLRD